MIYVLHSRPPIRAYAISAVLCLVGAVLIALGTALEWPAAVPIGGGVVLLLGLVLAALTLRAPKAGRIEVELTQAGYEIRGHGEPIRGSWEQVTKVTSSDGGRTITLHHGTNSRTRLMTPSTALDPEFRRLAEDITMHLDRDRGYGS